MVQRKEIYKEVFKHTGYWKYAELYDMVFEWFKNRDWILKEEMYNEKIQANGKEVIIRWVAIKEITDYFMFEIVLEWHILGMKDAEVEIDGEKVKTNKGEVEIVFKSTIIKDYERRWETLPLWKFMRALYEKHVIKATVDEFEEKLREDETKVLINDIKGFLRISHKSK